MKKCFYCNAPASEIIKLEQHHIFGNINSDLGVDACLNCHAYITKGQQKGIPKYAREKNSRPIVNALQGIHSYILHQQLCLGELDRVVINALKEEAKDGNSVYEDIYEEKEGKR